MADTLTITRPDDWHAHLHDGDLMASVVGATARQFARAIVMPNLKPPVTTAEMAVRYRERILAALPAGVKFEPLMTLYLTDNTTAGEIQRAKECGVVQAVKYYPAGATTNSDSVTTSGDLRILGNIQPAGRCTATSSRFAAAWARARDMAYVRPAS